MSLPNIKYRSGNFTVATAIGVLRNESPLLPYVNNPLVFHQDYVILERNFVRLPLNTENPDTGTGDNRSYLVSESPREDFGGGVVRWTRTWARVPDSYTRDGGIFQYQFPGFDAETVKTSRIPYTKGAGVTIQCDFYLIGPGKTYETFEKLVEAKFVKAFAPYFPNPDDATDTSFVVETLDSTTKPTLSEYRAMITNKKTLDAQDSSIRCWMGNIYVRERYLIQAF